MRTSWWRGSAGATLLGLCAALGACGSQPRTPDRVEWNASAAPVEADRYDYLTERQADMLPRLVAKLGGSTDPALRRALSCLRAAPPARVLAGEIQLDELRDLIAAALSAMPAAEAACLPVAPDWRYSPLEARYATPAHGGAGGGALEGAMMGGALWLLLCGNTLGLLCPVGSGDHFRLSVDISLPDGTTRGLAGDANAARWRASAWAYKKARDEAFASGLAEALLEIARAYAATMPGPAP